MANSPRFLMEVTEAVTSVWGANRVGVRLSVVHLMTFLTLIPKLYLLMSSMFLMILD